MYIHCCSCPWEQDDFWSKRYNPFTRLVRDIQWLWIPKMVRTENLVFSWFWLARCINWRVTAPFRQRWWTYESWKKTIAKNGGKWPCCPKCGEHSLTLD